MQLQVLPQIHVHTHALLLFLKSIIFVETHFYFKQNENNKNWLRLPLKNGGSQCL